MHIWFHLQNNKTILNRRYEKLISLATSVYQSIFLFLLVLPNTANIQDNKVLKRGIKTAKW